jgi:RecB family exonuclease
VYPYRVGAGVHPAHHFIVNASHESTEAADSSLAFLREDQRESLGFTAEDTGPRFLALYASSGRTVSFSFAGETRRNAVLPPGFFVARDRVRPAPSLDNERRDDAALRETRFWAGGAASPFPRGPLPHQRDGFERYAAAAAAPKGIDAAWKPFPAGSAAEKLREKVSREGTIRLSPTLLEVFAACPFRFLLEKVLGIGELSLETAYDNPRVEGNLYHDAFRDLMREIARRDGFFRAEDLPAYRDLVPPLLGDIFAGILRRDEYPPRPVRAAWAERMADDLAEFLEREAGTFDGFETRGTELSLSAGIDEARAVLTGRLDRVAGRPGDPACVVVDYKTGKLPTRKSLRGEEGEPVSVQIPAYVFLLEKSGSPVRAALYYSVRGGGYENVFAADQDDAWLDADAMAQAETRLVGLLASSAERLRAGDYRVIPGECEPCAFRGVCRRKYLSEREGGT